MDWESVFADTFDNRPVEGMRYREGDLRVRTVTKSEFPGRVFGDGSSTTIIPPMEAGTTIDIDAVDRMELRSLLIEEGEFSENDADAIVARF